MNWWRAHHGISNDAKLGLVAMSAKARRGEVLAVWVILLDYASQTDNRGNCKGIAEDEIAFMTGFDEDVVRSIMEAIRKRGLLHADGTLDAGIAFKEYDNTAAQRMRRYRGKTQDSNDDHVTDRDALLRSVTPVTAEEIRVEERREEKTYAPNGACVDVHPSLPSEKKPVRRRSGHRTTEEIRQALGAERLSWWENFWRAFPCHEGMNACMGAFEARVRDRDTAVALYRGAQAYAAKLAADPTAKPKWGQGWINEERWLDENKIVVPIPVERVPSVSETRRAQALAGMKLLRGEL